MQNDSQKAWLAHLAEDRRYAAMAGLGFSSGLPFLLVYSTQSAWPPSYAPVLTSAARIA
jgi:hypothetical protein